MIESGDRIVAGVSGGADSVCLLMVLSAMREELDFELTVVHVEHGIRGTESTADAEFTMRLCEGMEIDCQVFPVDVPAYAQREGLGLEEAARILRYRVFMEQAKTCGGNVALAHHMEDNAETLLFQMVRGSGLKGMCGIDPVRDSGDGVRYIRPLLCVRREEIEAYLQAQGQEYCTDSTNLELVYSRNRMRHQVIPQLREINTQAVEHLNRSAAQLRQVWDYMYQQAEVLLEQLLQGPPYVVDAAGLCQVHPALQTMVVHELIARVAGAKKDITSQHVKDLIALAQGISGKQLYLPYGIRVRKEFQNLVFEHLVLEDGRRQTEQSSKETMVDEEIPVSGQVLEQLTYGEKVEVPLGQSGAALVLIKHQFDRKMHEISKIKYTKWMDYDKIKDGFLMRKRRAGDFFVNDASGHHKKLKQYFIDEKIPISVRDAMWLMTKKSEVLWIVGGRMSEACKVSADTETVLEIAYVEGREHGFYERI